MMPAQHYGVEITAACYLLPSWALVKLHADPRSPLHEWRRQLRTRDPELHQVLAEMCLAAIRHAERVSDKGRTSRSMPDSGTRLVTTQQAAERVGCTPRSITRAIGNGTLKSTKVGRMHLIDPNELQRWADQRGAGKDSR
jgi:excisionase family DNA binding protein